MPYVYIHAILIVSVIQDGESQGRICTGLNGAHIKVVAELMRKWSKSFILYLI